MLKSKFAFFIWNWGTTILFAALIYWLATVPHFSGTVSAGDELVKVVYRILLYSVFFLLLYRAIMGTLKSTVGRLAKWHSKREAQEDAEFMLIIETLVVFSSVLFVTLYAVFEEYMQNFIAGRNPELRDVLVSLMAVLLTGLVVYSMPVIGELEVALHEKLKKEIRWLKSKRGSKAKKEDREEK